MNHTYPIIGMHCQSCIAKVKAALESLPQVHRAVVTLGPDQAVVEMSSDVTEVELAAVLRQAGDYLLAENPSAASNGTAEASTATYYPLLLILAYLAGVSAWSYWNSQFNPASAMSTFMGGFFLVFSFFKFLDLKGFALSFSSYDIIARRWPVYGFIYPFIELVLGIAYTTGLNPLDTNVVTIVVMSVGTIGVVQSLLQKRAIQCACLGTVFNLPMSKVTLVEDLLMVAMAGVMLVLSAS